MLWAPNVIVHQRYQLQQLKRERPGHQAWLALDQTHQQKVIIKTLSFTGQIQWDEVKLFEREIAILQRLNHPCLPTYIDHFSQDQPYYQKCLVESYIPAPSLQAFLDRQQPIPQAQIWAIAVQILEILDYLHQQKPPIFHRDIKPSNILIDRDKTVYLIDLGAAGIGHNRPENLDSPTTVGSFGYTPPEQFMGQPQPASDLYALGATLMQLLTQTPPHELTSPQLRLLFPQDFSIDLELRHWIYQLTSPQISDRIPTAHSALALLKKAQKAPALKISTPQKPIQDFQGVDETWQLNLPSPWNRDTIARRDLILLSALGGIPLLVGLWGLESLVQSFQGWSWWGAELMIFSLLGVPGLVWGRSLAGQLLRQTLTIVPGKWMTVKSYLSEIPVGQSKLDWPDLSTLKWTQASNKRWILTSKTSQGSKTITQNVTREQIDQIYQLLEASHQIRY